MSFLFFLCVYIVSLVASLLLWSAATNADVIDKIESFVEDLGAYETWQFEQAAGLTPVVRSFSLHPRSAATRPLLWLISLLLRRAIARHLRQMQQAGGTDPQPLAPQANEAG